MSNIKRSELSYKHAHDNRVWVWAASNDAAQYVNELRDVATIFAPRENQPFFDVFVNGNVEVADVLRYLDEYKQPERGGDE